MARNSSIASLIDGFNAGYDTVARVMRDKEIGDISKTKPETIDGNFPEQSPEQAQQVVADQMANDSGGAEAVKIARASAGPRTAPSYAMLGIKQDTPFTPDQESRARQLAMAGVMEKHGDVEGGSRLRDRVQQADTNAQNLAENKKRSAREDQLFPLQVAGLERTERTAAQVEADAKAARDVNNQVGDWFQQRLTQPDGSKRTATVDDHLASSQYRADRLMAAGLTDLAGKAVDEHSARAAVKIQLESAQRAEALKVAAAKATAGDLSGVVDFYNKFVPDGSRVTGVDRGAKGEIIVNRESMDGRQMPPTKLRDMGELLSTLNTFNDPMALYNWSQGEFKNNLALRQAANAEKQTAISGGHLGVAQAGLKLHQDTYRDTQPERDAKNAESGLRIQLAETEDPVEQAKLEGKIAALRTGSRGSGANADPAAVKTARALVASGNVADMATALEMVTTKPDQTHKAFVEAALKLTMDPKKAVADADTMMEQMGWRHREGRWSKTGGAAQLKDVTPADITATAKKHNISEAEVRKRLNLPAQ
jgi:hypothetical protein